ncbi:MULTISPECIES: hypothetical protein [Gracilibacillus]|uniref:hypothetical protein n=1 Tax=Gracilibacillus TaxID=74385 RepID=UPI000AE1BD5B|nr:MULTISPECIES: hypothetical protein [Gracilibacillus]
MRIFKNKYVITTTGLLLLVVATLSWLYVSEMKEDKAYANELEASIGDQFRESVD